MDDGLRQIVYGSLAEVFEKMFFTLLEPLPELPASEEWQAAGPYFEATLAYEGECQTTGTVRFFFPAALARHIALNFLGAEESELAESQVLDVVREAINMSVGSMLGQLDPEGGCRLGIPEARQVDDFSAAALQAEPGLCGFRSNHGILLVDFAVH